MDGGQAADLSWIDAASERFQRAWKKRPRAVSRISSPKWRSRNGGSGDRAAAPLSVTSAGEPARSREPKSTTSDSPSMRTSSPSSSAVSGPWRQELKVPPL